ncbi:MAG: hypothetical protein H7336_04300 [Bacteriovorax sp.]|nr:hypothetical protein [Bacteriovorax sp.]
MIRLKAFTLLFAGLLLLMNSALAEGLPLECKASDSDKKTKSIDLRSEMPPLRDQGSIGWCYGFTAADLMSHYLYKTKGKSLLNPKNEDYLSKKFSVSAIGVSTAYNESVRVGYNNDLRGKMLTELQKLNKKVFPEGGTVAEAIKIAAAKGICFEKDLSADDFSYVNDYRCAIKNNCVAADIFNIVYDTPGEAASCNDLFSIQKMFSTLDIKTIQKILATSARENAINNLVNASCGNRFANTKFDMQKGPVVQAYNLGGINTPAILMASMDLALDKGVPVGILYFSDFLTREEKSQTLKHASTIVGKRFNPKTCEVEYILRNSWGTGCGNYTKDNPVFNQCIDALKPLFKAGDHDKKAQQDYFNGVLACRKNNPPLPRNSRILCDEASSHVIIRKSDLEKQVYNLTMIKEDERF